MLTCKLNLHGSLFLEPGGEVPEAVGTSQGPQHVPVKAVLQEDRPCDTSTWGVCVCVGGLMMLDAVGQETAFPPCPWGSWSCSDPSLQNYIRANNGLAKYVPKQDAV